jgi:hypothetical protein
VTNHNPIEEYIFWKHFIDKKLKVENSIPKLLYDLLDHAETDMMYYLIDKHQVLSIKEMNDPSIH